MKNYVSMSLELHLFFLRIMKEHALFLKVGFMQKDANWGKKAEWYFVQFEKMLQQAVGMSNGVVSQSVLSSGEVVTGYTLPAERKTSYLTGSPINTNITVAESQLQGGFFNCPTKSMENQVRRLNCTVIELLEGLISFKESILHEVLHCKMFTANYPLLIQHIIREAKLYLGYLTELEKTGTICMQNMRNTEVFWNQIMMEHALFIRGLLDPTQEDLIMTANGFAKDYELLLQEAKNKNSETMGNLTAQIIMETEKYRDFKAAGTEGILNCDIRSLILPLLADHVLREANHYLRILQE